MIEPLLSFVVLGSSDRYLLGNALSELTATGEVNDLDDPFGQLTGGLLLLGWTVLFAVVGAAVMRSRDVTD